MQYLKSLFGLGGGGEEKVLDDPDADFTDMSRAHSWYKTLSLQSTPFIFLCARNRQPHKTHDDPKDLDGKLHWYFFRAGTRMYPSGLRRADFKDRRIVDIMDKYPVDMNCLLSSSTASEGDLYYFTKLTLAELEEWLTSHSYLDALGSLKVHGKESPELKQELKIAVALEIQRMRKQTVEACRNIYKDLLSIGYIPASLNQPFDSLMLSVEG